MALCLDYLVTRFHKHLGHQTAACLGSEFPHLDRPPIAIPHGCVLDDSPKPLKWPRLVVSCDFNGVTMRWGNPQFTWMNYTSSASISRAVLLMKILNHRFFWQTSTDLLAHVAPDICYIVEKAQKEDLGGYIVCIGDTCFGATKKYQKLHRNTLLFWGWFTFLFLLEDPCGPLLDDAHVCVFLDRLVFDSHWSLLCPMGCKKCSKYGWVETQYQVNRIWMNLNHSTNVKGNRCCFITDSVSDRRKKHEKTAPAGSLVIDRRRSAEKLAHLSKDGHRRLTLPRWFTYVLLKLKMVLGAIPHAQLPVGGHFKSPCAFHLEAVQNHVESFNAFLDHYLERTLAKLSRQDQFSNGDFNQMGASINIGVPH